MRQPKEVFSPVLNRLEDAFRQLEAKVPRPVRKSWLDGFVFRYAEQTIQQAIVQKLARMISGLHAIETLLERGLFQEQGMVQRAVDEISQDVLFLSYGIIRNDITSLHVKFLKYFYAEEFADPSNVIGSHMSRGMIRREKIRAYIEKDISAGQSASEKAAGKVLTKAYSGFVHAASPHIMDMYGGRPPRFDINGAFKPARYTEFERDALNYFYRSVVSMAFAATALGDDNLFSSMRNFVSELETWLD